MKSIAYLLAFLIIVSSLSVFATADIYTPADIDNDNKVTALDVIHLARYLAKWAGYETLISLNDGVRGDVNSDALVTSEDVVILSRHLASWTGYSNLPHSESTFINNVKVTNANGSLEKTSVSSQESAAYNLGFLSTVTATSDKASGIDNFGITCDLTENDINAKAGDIVQLIFYARAKEKTTPVKASILSKSGSALTNTAGTGATKAEYTYYIPTQWTKIGLPVTVSDAVGALRFNMGKLASSVEFGGVEIKVADEGAEQLLLPNGYFLCEPYTKAYIEYTNNNYISKDIITKCLDIETDGEYIYAIGNGNFYVVRVSDNKLISSLSGLGEVRQLAINEEGTTAVVTSRVDGAFVIGLDDKSNPKMLGRCDTLEYATGVSVSGNYACITNRTHGTEVIDISDRTMPKTLSNFRIGEAQSCQIVGTTVYAGVWGGRFVEVWDISQPSNPVLLNGGIPLDGKGDGLFVYGNYLYASTGHHANNNAESHPLHTGYGLGNGLDIYDISDVTNPVLVSSVKTEDHYYMRGYDSWLIKVAEHDGRIYAYLSESHLGVYIFDVTDPYAPIRLATVELTVSQDKNASKYNSLVKMYGHTGVDENKYYPYDTTVRHNSPVYGFAMSDGKMFLGGNATGLAVVDTSTLGDIIYREANNYSPNTPDEPSGDYYDLDLADLESKGFIDPIHVMPGGQVYSVTYKDGYIYAACGNQGIKILDEELNVIKEIAPVEGAIVSEIAIKGNRIYTAEGLKGIAIYELSDDGLTLTEISRYISKLNSTSYSVKFILLSPDGNYVLCDSGSSHSELVDFTDINNPVRWAGEGTGGSGYNGHSGLMYWRQISPELINGRYACVYGNANNIFWYDFGTDPENSNPVLMYENPKCGLATGSGYFALNGKNSRYAIGIQNNKFFFVDPSECDASTSYSSLPHYDYSNNTTGTKVYGKATMYGDLMLLNERCLGNVYICDMSELDIDNGKYNISVIGHYNFKGNPDIARICGDRIVYPLGNQGILSFTLAK